MSTIAPTPVPKENLLQKITFMVRVVRIFLAPILMIGLLAFTLIALPQGGDLLVKTSENSVWYASVLVLLGLFFWSYMVWYSSRILSYYYARFYDASHKGIEKAFRHVPRALGFYVYAVFVIAFLNALYPKVQAILSGKWVFLVLLGVWFYYILLHKLLEKLSCHWRRIWRPSTFDRFYVSVFILNGLVLFTFGVLSTDEGVPFLLLGALTMQVIFLFLVGNRHRVGNISPPPAIDKLARYVLGKIFKGPAFDLPVYEYLSFVLLNLIAIVALLVFLLSVYVLGFSIVIGTLGVLLLALGFYTGLFNIIKVLSGIYKVNILFFVLAALFLGSFLNDTHKVRTIAVEAGKQRMQLDDYFEQWLDAHAAELMDDSVPEVPVIFVHSAGGASRSGYWTASVLGRIDSLTEGYWGRHLFALSGSSGGSLGNAAYYGLLYKGYTEQPDRSLHGKDMVAHAQEFLKTDFLTFTIARMLAPGFLNYFFPMFGDRAAALELSMEGGAEKDRLLYRFFEKPFSSFYDLQRPHGLLPILCINTTRMQDGKPGIISNVCLGNDAFGSRADVLSLLKEGQDIRLSTAVVLGARFPYLSPAGRIDEEGPDGPQRHYFVDGGYFDNSGAGVVHEMIMEIKTQIKRPLYRTKEYAGHLSKLKVWVMHINNSPMGIEKLQWANPMLNDLASPLLTLSGSYSSQTSVNDARLRFYLESLDPCDVLGHERGNYSEVNLNGMDGAEEYSMNWVISGRTLKRMDQRLDYCRALYSWVRRLDAIRRPPNGSWESDFSKR